MMGNTFVVRASCSLVFASEQDARTTQTPHNLCGQILVVCPINFERFVVRALALQI